MRRLVVKAQQLICLQRHYGTSLPFLFENFDLVDAGSPALNDGAKLATDPSLSGQVLKQRNYGIHFDTCYQGRSSFS